jgi:hypothetical protein
VRNEKYMLEYKDKIQSMPNNRFNRDSAFVTVMCRLASLASRTNRAKPALRSGTALRVKQMLCGRYAQEELYEYNKINVSK